MNKNRNYQKNKIKIFFFIFCTCIMFINASQVKNEALFTNNTANTNVITKEDTKNNENNSDNDLKNNVNIDNGKAIDNNKNNKKDEEIKENKIKIGVKKNNIWYLRILSFIKDKLLEVLQYCNDEIIVYLIYNFFTYIFSRKKSENLEELKKDEKEGFLWKIIVSFFKPSLKKIPKIYVKRIILSIFNNTYFNFEKNVENIIYDLINIIFFTIYAIKSKNGFLNYIFRYIIDYFFIYYYTSFIVKIYNFIYSFLIHPYIQKIYEIKDKINSNLDITNNSLKAKKDLKIINNLIKNYNYKNYNITINSFKIFNFFAFFFITFVLYITHCYSENEEIKKILKKIDIFFNMRKKSKSKIDSKFNFKKNFASHLKNIEKDNVENIEEDNYILSFVINKINKNFKSICKDLFFESFKKIESIFLSKNLIQKINYTLENNNLYYSEEYAIGYCIFTNITTLMFRISHLIKIIKSSEPILSIFTLISLISNYKEILKILSFYSYFLICNNDDEFNNKCLKLFIQNQNK